MVNGQIKPRATYNCAVCDIQVIKEYVTWEGLLSSEVIFCDDCKMKLKEVVGKI